MKWYYYLHVNGNLIGKNPAAVDPDPEGYFEGPFVVEYWCIETTNRAEAWKMILEALALGGHNTVGRVRELVAKWGLTLNDSFEYISRNLNPTKEQHAGLKIFCKKFLGLTEDEYFERFKVWGKKKQIPAERR